MMRVAHIITGLDVGGAETVLGNLVARFARMDMECTVISVTHMGVVGERIERMGIPVRALGMRRGVPDPWRLVRLAQWLRKLRPDVVQTWMYHADLIGGLAAYLSTGAPVVWNIRQSEFDLKNTKWLSHWTAKTCARLSGRVPSRIICCGEAARKAHIELGYDARKIVVIPNGFDTARFQPDSRARSEVRRELKLPDGALVVGMFARFDPWKDHWNFIQAMARVHRMRRDVRFLLCGHDITWENVELRGWIENAGLRESWRLLGRREDVPRLMAALDVAVLSSTSEGFPNVVGEAMACGVPCVVTDVGDARTIVGNTGRVVPPRDPEALAAACLDLLGLEETERLSLGEAARRRIQEYFTLDLAAERYHSLYAEVVSNAGAISKGNAVKVN